MLAASVLFSIDANSIGDSQISCVCVCLCVCLCVCEFVVDSLVLAYVFYTIPSNSTGATNEILIPTVLKAPNL